jgi:hypothetical protein
MVGIAKRPAGLIGADAFMPLELEQFRHAFMLFLYVLNGDVKASPPTATFLDPDTGSERPLEDTIFNRAWVAAGKLFEDEALRLSFHRRLEVFGSLCREPAYERYLGFCRPSLHLAFVAALARFPFSKIMTEKACMAAFDEELRRQLGSKGEDRSEQAVPHNQVSGRSGRLRTTAPAAARDAAAYDSGSLRRWRDQSDNSIPRARMAPSQIIIRSRPSY